MAGFQCLLVSGALLLCLCTLTTGQYVTVTVNSQANNTECLSAQQLLATSTNDTRPQSICRTVNDALGNVSCNYSCTVSEEDRLDGVVIRLEDGVHQLTGCVGVIQSQNVIFEAVNADQATLTCTDFPNSIEDNFDNLLVCTSTNVTFRGIRFERCGPTAPNVFLNETSDIVFDSCTFFENQGTPLQLQFCTRVEVINSFFIQNNNSVLGEPDVSETDIEELYSRITTSGGFTFFSRNDDVELLIHNCSFLSNSANKNDPNNSRPVLLKENGHGGAVLIRLVGTRDAQITISDSIFYDNTAQVDGGAVYISLSETVVSSILLFQNNNFTNNRVDQASGGAVSINSFTFTFNNSIMVEDCDFNLNSGNAGGAFSVALYDSDLNSTRHPDVVNFTRCAFNGNTAENEGTAVGLFSLVHVDQIGFPVDFTDCTFVNNTSLEESQDTSAIAAFRFPTIFSGSNNFTGNIGGGITLLNTRMQASGTLRFEDNEAVFGGGLAMDDRCLLEISPNTTIIFRNNKASESGGGIYVEFPPIRFVVDIFNRLCFLQYKDPQGADVEPQSWENVDITFIRNTARLSGAAIFASDMQQCGWLGNEFTTNRSVIFQRPNISNDSYYPFTYIENSLLPEGQNVSILTDVDLATSPSRIHYTIPEYEYVQPGEVLQINLLATDQVDNSREAVWSLEAPSAPANLDALSANNDSHPYEVPSVQNLPGVNVSTSSNGDLDFSGVSTNFSSEFELNFSLLRTLGSVTTLPLSVNGCHPGYVLDADGECTCDTSNSAILRCDDSKRYLYLREGTWGGVDENRKLITARVQPGYVTCIRQGRLQGCEYKFDDQDRQCRRGRQGPLCGQCVERHAVTLDLLDCQEEPCSAGLSIFILLCIAVVVLCLLFLIFDFTLPNELKAFFFYAQVIGLVYRPYQVVQDADDQITRGLSVMLNLLGFSVPFPLCLWSGVHAHHVALLGYISPILALLTIICYVIAAQFFSALGKHSALNGLTFISLFAYKYVADTALLFVSCIETDLGFVFQYDGSLQCTSLDFGIFAVIGLALVVFFVFPTPFVVGYICVKRPLLFQHYADVLTRGLRSKHRWWGGWDLGRRLPFVAISYFVVYTRPSFILFLMSLTALAVLIIHVFTKPFEKMHTNVIEAAILLNLLMVTAAFLDPSNSPVPFAFSTILVLLPYVYAAGYTVFMISRALWKRMKKSTVKSKPSDTDETRSSSINKADTPGEEQADVFSPGKQESDNSLPGSENVSGTVGTSVSTGGNGATSDNSLLTAPKGGDQVRQQRAMTLSEDFSALREPLLEDL